MHWNHTDAFVTTAKITSLVCFVVIIALLVLHIHRMSHRSNLALEAAVSDRRRISDAPAPPSRNVPSESKLESTRESRTVSSNPSSASPSSRSARSARATPSSTAPDILVPDTSITPSSTHSKTSSRVSILVRNIKTNSDFQAYLSAHILTVIVLLCFALNTLFFALQTMGWLTPEGPLSMSCRTYYRVVALSLHLGRGAMAYLMLLRVKWVYQRSEYAYSAAATLCIFVLVSVWLIALFVWDATVLDGTWNAEWAYCETNFVQHAHVLVVYVTILFDVCIQAMTLALFLYPLMALRKRMQKDRERADELDQVGQVMIHYSNLAVKVVASSCVCLPMAAYLNVGLVLLIDNVVKSVCAVLYFREVHKGLYHALCCCDRVCVALTRSMTSTSMDEKNVAADIEMGNAKEPKSADADAGKQATRRDLDLIVMRLASPLEMIC